MTKRDFINPSHKLLLLQDYIINLNLAYTVQLTLYCTPFDEPHDRDILTNYFKLHSGHSLDYYNKKGLINKNTTLQIIELNGQDENPHKHLLKSMAAVTSRGKMNFDMFGNGTNRLLKF